MSRPPNPPNLRALANARRLELGWTVALTARRAAVPKATAQYWLSGAVDCYLRTSGPILSVLGVRLSGPQAETDPARLQDRLIEAWRASGMGVVELTLALHPRREPLSADATPPRFATRGAGQWVTNSEYQHVLTILTRRRGCRTALAARLLDALGVTVTAR